MRADKREYTQHTGGAARGLPPPWSWARLDTVLLDMDGTILDLAYDNHFWREALPRAYGEAHGIALLQAQQRLFAHMARVEGTLEWYCLDYWSSQLALDVRALKRTLAGRIGFLPAARDFLLRLRAMSKRLVLVTNAHRDTLSLKLAHTGLESLVDALYSAHDFRQPKESPAFWPAFHAREGFDPQRTLLLEDNLAVLHAARAFGVAALVAVAQPDSSQPVRAIRGFPAVKGIGDLLPHIEME